VLWPYKDDECAKPSTKWVTGRVSFNPCPFTADDVRRRRNETGESMMEAKRKLRIEAFEESFGDFRATASLEDKVDFILDWIKEREVV